ncbi:Calsyntenin-2, partial [Sarracenia purpurea var. burkii]
MSSVRGAHLLTANISLVLRGQIKNKAAPIIAGSDGHSTLVPWGNLKIIDTRDEFSITRCSFIVGRNGDEIKKRIILRKNGEAELRARKALNCEKKKNYKFDIVAVACSGEPSE